jgi:hypothetical protein
MPLLRHKPTGRIFPFVKIMSERADMEFVEDAPAESKKQKAVKQPKVTDAPVDNAVATPVVPVVAPAAPTADEVSFEE